MITGVTIGAKDTLTDFGLALCDDLKIGAAKLKSVWADVPGADGALNLSFAITGGEPRYDMRDITFSLVSTGAKCPAELTEDVQNLSAYAHGREMKVWLPDDLQHYFKGVVEIGDLSGYNRNQIPVAVKAYPWRYKNAETVVTVSVTAGSTVHKAVTNETKKVCPSFTTTATATVKLGTHSHQIQPGQTYTFDDIILGSGTSTIDVSAAVAATVTIRYQEAVL